MITIFNKQGIAYNIRPCPFINLTWNTKFNEGVNLGGKYDIVLTGTLLSHAGSPVFVFNNRLNPNADTVLLNQYYPAGDNSKPPETVTPIGPLGEKWELNSILAKQQVIRDLFSANCAKIEVASVKYGETEPLFHFYPRLISINFQDGIWVDRCDYTINLEAEFLLDRNDKVIGSESYSSPTFKPGEPGWPIAPGPNGSAQNIHINLLLEKIGGFVDDFQESWSLEPEEGNGNTVDPYSGNENITRIYRLTRNITAKGKNISGYECFGNQPAHFYQAHEQARRYVYNHIQNSGTTSNHYDDYPGSDLNAYFGSGLINLSARAYGGYNHSRNENIDITQGTFSIQDTWILSSGTAYENYTLSLNQGENDKNLKVTIDGTIKGLTSIPASGSVFGGNARPGATNTAYENAINKYRSITNFGQFGISAHTYKRAQAAAGGFTLNSKPLSLALSTNEFTGEINYTIDYDTRPASTFNGVVFENVSITDTYPGDVFSVIPVIGRPTGPVLQYIGGRTEYRRSLSIELVADTNYSSVNQNRPDYIEYLNRQQLLSKPSLVSPSREAIVDVINAYSPGREPGIRKYFVSPPQETWDPKSGRYTLNIDWTYELSY